MLEQELLTLRFYLFKYCSNSILKKPWDLQNDQLLKMCIRYIFFKLWWEIKIYCYFWRKINEDPLSTNSAQQLKVSWTLVSQEFNKEVQEIRFFKTEKQCKERWFNHLSPSLKKYLIKSWYYLIFFIFKGKNGHEMKI